MVQPRGWSRSQKLGVSKLRQGSESETRDSDQEKGRKARTRNRSGEQGSGVEKEGLNERNESTTKMDCNLYPLSICLGLLLPRGSKKQLFVSYGKSYWDCV